jgi:hypothetical protein
MREIKIFHCQQAGSFKEPLNGNSKVGEQIDSPLKKKYFVVS